MTPDRILIVGLGSIGKRHLRLARELLPQADIRVLRHRECGDVPEYSNGCFYEMDRAVEFSPQIAVIANPAPYHVPAAQRLAQAGAHLLIEKPIAAALDGVRELLATARAAEISLLTGYNLRFLPSLRKFRDLIAAGEVGQVLSVRCEIGQYLPSWRPDTDYRDGVSAQRRLGGGALLELSHEIDYLRWTFGEIDQVQARIGRQSALEIDVEDTAHLLLDFAPAPNGHRLIGTLSMDFVRHDATRLCTAIGEQGSLRWNGVTGSVEKFARGAKEWSTVFHHQAQRDESYLAEWRHFLDCVRREAVPLISGADGLRVLEIVEAARQASETGRQARVGADCGNSLGE